MDLSLTLTRALSLTRYGYNAGKKIYMAKRELWKQMQVGAIHFVGRPKPWDVPYNPTSPPAAQLRSRLADWTTFPQGGTLY